MTAVATHSRATVTARARDEREARNFRRFSVGFVLAGAIGLAFGDADVRAVLGPALVLAATALFYLTVQIRREGQLPIFEAATLFVIATAIYSIMPLLQFALGGMRCGPWSDNRLYQWNPTPQEFGGFAWRHVVLLATFVLVYLPIRGRRLWPQRRPDMPERTTFWVIVVMMIIISLWFAIVRIYAGPAGNPYMGGDGKILRSMPLIVLQLVNVLQIVGQTLKQCLIILLLLRWDRRYSRIVLTSWMIGEVLFTLITFESRAATMLLLLTVGVGYHHLVRPLRVKVAFVIGSVVLLGFLVFGIFRDVDSATINQDPHAIWGAATEFQILFGTAYDLFMRRAAGTLPPVPWQIYFSDFYRLIPSQLLPFYKWDPAEWYMYLLGLGGTGQGFMFGVVAQSAVGFGYPDLIVRSFFLALMYAFAHRAYRRYSSSFWVTIAYLFMMTWAYYAFRSTSFDILYRLAYYLFPTWLLVKGVTILVTKVRGSGRRRAIPT